MDKIQQEFVDFHQRVVGSILPDPLCAKIIARLFIETEELALEDLAQETGFSLASISNKAKFLENMGLIKRFCKPGSKKIYLFMEKNILATMREHFLRKQELIMSQCKQGLPVLLSGFEGKKLNDREKKEILIIKDYLRQVQDAEIIFKEFIQKLDGGKHEK